MKRGILFSLVIISLILIVPTFTNAGIFDFLNSNLRSNSNSNWGASINQKNMSMYSTNEIFLISNRDWHDVLSLIPVTTWTENVNNDFQPESQSNQVIKKYPTLIYHEDKEPVYQNLALNKPTSASSNEPGWDSWYANDNNLLTGWTTRQDNSSWIVDLLNVLQTNRIEIQTDRHYNQILISGSIDNKNWFHITSSSLSRGFNRVEFSKVNTRLLKVEFGVTGDFKTIMDFRAFNINSNSTKAFDADSLIDFMQMYWKNDVIPAPKKLTLIGNSPQELDNLLITPAPLGPGLQENQIQRISPSQYFSYWQQYYRVVLVDYNDYKAGLIASEYASLINAPLVFVDQENILELKPYLQNKKINYVSSNNAQCSEECPEQYYQTLLSVSQGIERNSIVEMQKKYIQATNTDKIILVNPNDLNIFLESGFQPERSPYLIYNLFGEHSLASPFLAAAKHEIIILDDAPSSRQNINLNVLATDNVVRDNVINLFVSQNKTPNFLTIFASPEAISYRHNFDEGINEDNNFYSSNPDIGYSVIPSLIDNKNNFIFLTKNCYSMEDDDGGTAYRCQKMSLEKIDDNGNASLDEKIIHFFNSSIRAENIHVLPFAIDSKNNYHLVFGISSIGIFYKKISEEGQVVDESFLIGDSESGISNYPLNLVMDIQNNLHLFFSSCKPDCGLYYIKLNNSGNRLTPEKFIANVDLDAPGDIPLEKVVVDSKSNLHVFFISGIRPSKMFYIKLDNKGENLTPPLLVASATTKFSSFNIAKNSMNELFLVFSNSTFGSTGNLLWYQKLSTTGSILIKPMIIGENMSATIRLDSSENVQILGTRTSRGYGNQLTYSIDYIKLDTDGKIVITQKTLFEKTSLSSFDIDQDDFLQILFGGYYAKINNGGQIIIPKKILTSKNYFKLKTGRIYGITSSDISSYIARGIFYNQLTNNLYRLDEYTGMTKANFLNNPNINYLEAQNITITANRNGYNTLCFLDNNNFFPCVNDDSLNLDNYKHQQFITYNDHGGPNAWIGLTSSDIPWLEGLPVSIAFACNTNNYWDVQGLQSTFGPTFLRRGGMTYYGAIKPVSILDLNRIDSVVLPSLQFLTSRERKNLGEWNQNISDSAKFIAANFLMLGDPTLVPRFKYIDWANNYIPQQGEQE